MIEKIVKRIICFIGIILLTLVTIGNLLFTSNIANDRSEKVSIIVNNNIHILITVGIIALIMIITNKKLIYKIKKRFLKDELLEKENVKKRLKIVKYLLISLLLIIYLIIQFRWIKTINVFPVADQDDVYKFACKIYNSESIDGFKFYFGNYPQQLTLALVECLIFKLTNNSSCIMIQYCNVIANLFSVLGLWLISKELSKKYEINKFLLGILTLTYIPLILLSTFVYGDILSISFVLFSIYFIIKYGQDNQKWGCVIISAILMSIAYITRMNNLIYVIAISCYLILNLISMIAKIKDGNKLEKFMIKKNQLEKCEFEKVKYEEKLKEKEIKIRKLKIQINRIVFAIIMIFVFITISIFPGEVLKNTLLKNFEISKSLKYPASGYIYMGMREGSRANGWFNASIRELVKKENSDELYKGYIKGRVITMVKNPKYTFRFYSKKALSMWTENTNQSIWYSLNKEPRPGDSIKDYVIEYNERSEIEKKLLNNEQCIKDYTKALMIIIFGISLINLVYYRKNISNEVLLIIICFIGGFLFHMLWEGKARYILSYIIILIPIACIIPNISFKKVKRISANNKIDEKK